MKEFCKKNKNGILLTVCIIVHTILLYMMCDFEKSLSTYPDELIYYGLARNLYQGNGMQLHGTPFSFQNLAYTFFLVPFFAIQNITLRLKAIAAANACMMSLSVIPVWLICKEIKLKQRYTWYVLIIMLLWPDMLVAATFMSESIFWVIALFALYFIIKSFHSNQKRWLILSALFCYLSYFCKAVSLCLPLAYVAVLVLFPIFSQLIRTKEPHATKDTINANIIKMYKEEHTLQKLVLFTGVYVLCYVGAKLLFLLTPATGSYSLGVASIDGSTFYFICYFFYSLFYYVAAVLIAFFIYPIVYPMIHIRKLNEALQKSFFYLILLIIGTIYVIVFTITVNEDFGSLAPRVHLRYFSYVIGALLPIFFQTVSLVEEDKDYSNCKSKRGLISFIISGMVCVFGFKWAPSGCVIESLPLMVSTFLQRICTFLHIQKPDSVTHPLVVYPYVTLTAIGVISLLLLWGIFQYVKRFQKYFSTILAASMAAVCLLNTVLGYGILKPAYQKESTAITEMSQINDFFDKSHLKDRSVLYVAENGFAKADKIYDTYFENSKNYATTAYDLFLIHCGDRDINIATASISESVYRDVIPLDSIDYLIINAQVNNITKYIEGIELIPEISGAHYSVYRNLNPAIIDGTTPDRITYDFTEEGYNAYFGIDGVDMSSGDYSWTNDKEMTVEGWLPEDVSAAVVTVQLDRTYHGVQEVTVYQYEQEIYQTYVKGNESFSFEIHPYKGNFSFDMKFPRKDKYALGLKSITIDPAY